MSGEEKRRWPRAEAIAVARELCTRLKPHCSRLIVAGSLRRRKESVGDVEILYVSRMGERHVDLFSDFVALAEFEIEQMLGDRTLCKRELKEGRTSWGEKNKLARHVASGIPVDLFRTTEQAWYNYLVCRTGPAESNTAIASAALRKGYQWNPYGVGFHRIRDRRVVPMGTEEAVFRFVGLPYREPWER